MHHKKKRPASQRGTKYNKPWKCTGFPTERPDGERFSDYLRRHKAALEIAEVVDEDVGGHRNRQDGRRKA